MSMITQDDVAAFEALLAKIADAEQETRDLVARLQRKADWRHYDLQTAVSPRLADAHEAARRIIR